MVIHNLRADWRRVGVHLRWGLGFGVWVLGFSVAVAYAQFFGGELNTPIRRAPEVFPDRNFTVCRLQYREVRSEPNGGGWRTDYPYGEINLMIRFSELTRTRVSWERERQPYYFVVRAMDDALFQCPFLIASDVGTVGFGVFTRVPYATLPIFLAWLFVSGNVVIGLAAGLVYGVLRAASIYSSASTKQPEDVISLNERLMSFAPFQHALSGVALAAFGAYMLIAPVL